MVVLVIEYDEVIVIVVVVESYELICIAPMCSI